MSLIKDTRPKFSQFGGVYLESLYPLAIPVQKATLRSYAPKKLKTGEKNGILLHR